MIGGGAFTGRHLALPLALLALLALDTSPASAQDRVLTTHRASEPEGRLLAYYSATMIFSSLGAHRGDARWSVALEGTWIPALSEAERRPGIDKPEATNLAPVLPRPRLVLRTGRVTLEGAWIPPVRIGSAQADLRALALSGTVARWRGVGLSPRLSLVSGRVRGAITCNARTADAGGVDLARYYAAVCHGRDSDDWFEPRLIAGEVVADRPWAQGHNVWIALGGRVDRSRFDIGVRHPDGRRDLDHPILRLHDTRPHGAAGVQWPLARRLVGAAEWFYAPGSVGTIRAMLTIGGGVT